VRELHKLSARSVAALNEPGRYADGGGLYLQVARTGRRTTKSWLFRYMLDGRARHMGLGSTATFSLAEARERARIARQQLVDRIDPIEARLQEREDRRKEHAANTTFKKAAEEFLDVHEAGWKNTKHRQQWRNTLATYAYNKLGSRPISAIGAQLINETVAPIWQKKPETASRVKQRIERIVQWIKDGKPLPAASNGNAKRHHPALPYAQIPEFMDELRGREGTAARALEFMILCAVRTGDLIGGGRDEKPPMKWPHVDLDARVWTIPSTKTDSEHRVPLSDRAVEILESMPRESGSELVFPGSKAKQPLSNAAMAAVVDRLNDGREQRGLGRFIDPKQNGRDVVPHGFRSSFRDWTADCTNYHPDVAEATLAHKIENKARASYERGDKFEKRRHLMHDWAKFCERKPVAQDAAVVVLHGARGAA
jgi:integrase